LGRVHAIKSASRNPLVHVSGVGDAHDPVALQRCRARIEFFTAA
jgi:hypothetical protein